MFGFGGFWVFSSEVISTSLAVLNYAGFGWLVGLHGASWLFVSVGGPVQVFQKPQRNQTVYLAIGFVLFWFPELAGKLWQVFCCDVATSNPGSSKQRTQSTYQTLHPQPNHAKYQTPQAVISATQINTYNNIMLKKNNYPDKMHDKTPPKKTKPSST